MSQPLTKRGRHQAYKDKNLIFCIVAGAFQCIYAAHTTVFPMWKTDQLYWRTDASPGPNVSKCFYDASWAPKTECWPYDKTRFSVLWTTPYGPPLMMTSSSGNISALLVLCEGNPPATDRFPSQSDAELWWCFLWSVPEQTNEMPVIWDVITLIMTSL